MTSTLRGYLTLKRTGLRRRKERLGVGMLFESMMLVPASPVTLVAHRLSRSYQDLHDHSIYHTGTTTTTTTTITTIISTVSAREGRTQVASNHGQVSHSTLNVSSSRTFETLKYILKG
nr:uncharacterized protein LOC123749647 [Procambarus clarkii]XP_045587722.1 uncharacterized protein LOC123749647 [Procambarus clarkii]XP_045587723.1 uncharacterized protein LOC123749647 [Procambarus clarkii]XP_045587724.1 uncharacterized protein LOC123749647 [Procambarus clarkii]XP_045587725.1 uncharacterized protein LOC123749647 [Procambarus clarkii]